MKSFYITLLLVIAASCQSELDERKYVAWIEDPKNELHVVKSSADFVFDLQYQPSEYRSIQLGKKTPYQEVGSKQGTQQYLLKIIGKNLQYDWIKTGSQQEVQNNLYYFSYQFQEDIYIEENGEVLPCELLHFEQSQNTGSKKVFLLSFESRFSESKTATLVINSEYFGSLPIRMKISKGNLPKLKV